MFAYKTVEIVFLVLLEATDKVYLYKVGFCSYLKFLRLNMGQKISFSLPQSCLAK